MRKRVPKCFGWLFEAENRDCKKCLISDECEEECEREAQRRPKRRKDSSGKKTKKELILSVCRKFGIPTTYHSRKKGRAFEVSEENLDDFNNLDPLLTNKAALEILEDA